MLRQLNKTRNKDVFVSDMVEEMKGLNVPSLMVDWSLVEQCYHVWLQERHAAAERYLFGDALDCLSQLRSRFPDTCIAAITNGRGNPLNMPNTLQPYFDFCVSGEDEDIFPERKPHAGIYKTALHRYRTLYPHHDERSIWCHVGDCLANDVGASASCGAYAIWFCPDDHLDGQSYASQISSWSTATKSDLATRTQLANRARGNVAVSIKSLSQLVSAIDELMEGVPDAPIMNKL